MKTKIEWSTHSINPVKGLCPVDCPYCYARRMYKRFKWDETIRFEPLDYHKFPAGSKVFVGSTMELFGDWVKHDWLWQIFEWCKRLPDVTFIFLTKQPQNMIKWSPFPDNCWVGVSATSHEQYTRGLDGLGKIDAPVKFFSFEPLLHRMGVEFYEPKDWGINWLILGQQTPANACTRPKFDWIEEIVKAADRADIPIFLKDNLDGLLHHRWQDNVWGKLFRNENETLRQEFPKVGVKV